MQFQNISSPHREGIGISWGRWGFCKTKQNVSSLMEFLKEWGMGGGGAGGKGGGGLGEFKNLNIF